ncbi:MAG: succinate dehydrogenase cytochrome b subunit [Bacteroidales bacterium]|nr:succinate dehydrogenase cytochrome b subunit [Bacteroidales bacterium]
MSNTLSYSSITKKIWMSLFGLFLMTFLVVHLSINLLLLFDPSRELFNIAAHFMGTNPLIQIFQWVLFAGFGFHIILGVILQIQNWMARPKGYKVKGTSEDSVFSKYMIYTGMIIFVFLIIHLGNFFVLKMQGDVPEFHQPGAGEMEDMGLLVVNLFRNTGYVIFYVIMLLLMGFHLDHAFQSAFQSLGLTHNKYTPFIKGLGHFYSIVITAGYIIIPLIIYFR